MRSNMSTPHSSPSRPRTSHGPIDADKDVSMSCETPSTPRVVDKSSLEKRSSRINSSSPPNSARTNDSAASRISADKASGDGENVVSQNQVMRERSSTTEADQCSPKRRKTALEEGEIPDREHGADSPLNEMSNRRGTESEEENKHRSRLLKSTDTRSLARSSTPHSPPKVRKLSINHMDLLFLAIHDKLHCRMCM
jgi:hypothetical protein